MTFGHFVCLHRSISDASEILHKKRPLMLEKVVLVLLVGQQDLINRLCHCSEETTQLLFTVLASDTQLVQYTSHI